MKRQPHKYKSGQGLQAQGLDQLLAELKNLSNQELADGIQDLKEKLGALVLRQIKNGWSLTDKEIVEKSRLLDHYVNENLIREIKMLDSE
ncbi:MAG: hypothetical protein ACYCX2_09285 [Christensenellales bacterium]